MIRVVPHNPPAGERKAGNYYDSLTDRPARRKRVPASRGHARGGKEEACEGGAATRGAADEGLYRRVAKLTGMREDHLRQLASVAHRVEFMVRDHKLPWGHHRAVAKLRDPEEQRRWLAEAARDGLTRDQLREQIEQR